MSIEAVITKFQMLPPTAQEEAAAFIDFLAERSRPEKKRSPRPGFNFAWEGGLEELKEQFTAVELQHQINEIR
jgi:hypothetical protein